MKTMVHILVIDDNAHNLYMMAYLLERSGFGVFQASNGPDGVHSALTHHPALILLDIQLPGVDGYEVARTLRRHEALRETPIIAVTSHAMVGDRQRCLAAGCNDYIEKPIDPDGLLITIQSHLDAAREPTP